MRIKQLAPLAIVTTLCASLLVAPLASAITFSTENAIDGNTKLNFTRVITGLDSADAITNTFTYTITPNADNPAGSSGAPTSATVVFNNVTPQLNATTDELEATVQGQIDFAGTVYTRPGDYEYVVSETASSNATYELEPKTYTAIVSVRNYDDGTGVYIPGGADWLQGSVVAGMVNNQSGEKEANPIFGNSAANYGYIELFALENGNSADPYICFEYILEMPITDGITSSDMTFDITYEQSTINQGFCEGSATTVSPGTPVKIYLRHWQYANIGRTANGSNQIPIGAKYIITQSPIDGYTTSFDGPNRGSVYTTGVLTVESGHNGIEFTNIKDASVVTGFIVKALPYVVAAIIAGFGVVIVITLKKR